MADRPLYKSLKSLFHFRGNNIKCDDYIIIPKIQNLQL